MPPWCNISPKTYIQPRNPSVLHRWCNMHTLTNLFLPHATVMQHLLLRSHGVLYQWCNKHSSLTYSFCRPPSWWCNISHFEIMVCCINDATKTRSLTYSFHRPLWCNISPASKPMMQQTLLTNLFLLQATILVMQHLSLWNHGVLHQWCNKPLLLTLSSCRHSDATSLSAHKLGLFLWSGGVLQHRCNKL